MDELSQIIEQTNTASNERNNAQEKLNAFIEEVATGKRTTGDIVKDFAVAHSRIKDEDVQQLREMEQRITQAKGQPILVHTRFQCTEGASLEDGDDGLGCLPRSRSMFRETKDVSLLRFGIIGEPSWSLAGLDIAKPYAFQILRSKAWARKTPLLRFEDWIPYDNALRIGAAELFESTMYWPLSWFPRPNIDNARQDLSPTIIEKVNEGAFDSYARSSVQKTDILIGEQIANTIDTWTVLAHTEKGDYAKNLQEHVARTIRDAACCVEHGVNFKVYGQQQAEALSKRQTSLFQKIVDTAFANSEGLPELLAEAQELGVHNTTIKYSPRRGVLVDANEFLPELYRIQNINDVVEQWYKVAATLEDEK